MSIFSVDSTPPHRFPGHPSSAVYYSNRQNTNNSTIAVIDGVSCCLVKIASSEEIKDVTSTVKQFSNGGSFPVVVTTSTPQMSLSVSAVLDAAVSRGELTHKERQAVKIQVSS